ncbi:Aspartyl protease family protein 1 [Camellia lanceoleosa]|uniref:Aspartyl protease family protein 1 n=1 Tax=Camellia lanceoleosa TaxID=1840588 RepID=A0ACC0I2Z8_9ERIC|nr:Aspartyl protease family protein 1 [Camellia lanceoleosa]
MGHYYYYYYVVLMMMVVWGSQSCDGFGTFGFNIHHRYSDPVKGILDLRGLPEKGSLDYYAAMAHRDLLFHGRNLAALTSAPLTFLGGNDTYQLNALGHLFYANVSVGSPSLWFLVALDTGSDLFWLPCDCIQCAFAVLQTKSGQVIDFNIYSPSNSTSSAKVSCNSTFCGQCSLNTCPYYSEYLSNNTSSFGLLVEDVLHLTTDDSQLKAVDAQITFGCGLVQTGSFLDGGAPNGLFGLGMDNISVPSILANQGLTANSFSMCFGPDGIGRISFGDKGSSEQGETPFNLGQSLYNISITQITVEKNVTDLSFTAIFDSGTSFTYLTDPAYSVITEGFNSQAKEKRHPLDSQIPFEYCYDLSANHTTFETASLNLTIETASLNLTMKGGKQFPVTHPIEIIYMQGRGFMYCLAVVKTGDINIIGQNFMSGYRIIFDRERMVLGWESSNCYDANNSSTLPINPRNSGAVTPTTTLKPETTSSSTNGSPLPSPDASSDSPHLNSYTSTLHVVVILSLFIHGFVILSS